jgi:hypothetical protein
VVRCGSKNTHGVCVCVCVCVSVIERDWTMCSKLVGYIAFNILYNWERDFSL